MWNGILDVRACVRGHVFCLPRGSAIFAVVHQALILDWCFPVPGERPLITTNHSGTHARWPTHTHTQYTVFPHNRQNDCCEPKQQHVHIYIEHHLMTRLHPRRQCCARHDEHKSRCTHAPLLTYHVSSFPFCLALLIAGVGPRPRQTGARWQNDWQVNASVCPSSS